MSDAKTKPASPISNVSPHLVCDGAADAIDFYKKAFDATELMRLPGPNGRLIHGCISICGSSVMLVDENKDYNIRGPKALGGTPVTIHLLVDDVDAMIAQAEKAGAKVVMPAADMFWGDRYGMVEDPFGHRWSIATHLRDMTHDEITAAMEKAMPDFGCQ